MCTLTFAWQVFPEAPLVVAANRDESRNRPSLPPAVIESNPVVYAPLDQRARGTWMGVNEHGLFVGLTNRWVDGLTPSRSRGLLVRDCLRAASAAEAARLVVAALQAEEYDGFNLVVADGRARWGPPDVTNPDRDPPAAILLEWDGHLRVHSFTPGVHVVVNVGADGAYYHPPGRPEVGVEQSKNARKLRRKLRPANTETAAEWVSRTREAIADHQYGACVHENGYGTVSSALVTIRPDRAVRFAFADGPPCEAEFTVVQDGHLAAAIPGTGGVNGAEGRV